MPVIATAKDIQISPRKVTVVAALVRNQTVEDALTILKFTPRRAAIPVRKAIESAKANADYNHNYKPDTLRIIEISVTPGKRLKRFKPAARGRALPFQIKASHIRVVVDGEKRIAKKPAATKDIEATKEVVAENATKEKA
jgi:large subunit ribosomal protein L22